MPRFKVLCWGEAERLFAGRDSILRREDCELLLAASRREVVRLAEASHPGLILIDQEVAGGKLLGLCRRLKGGRRTAKIPIVVMSAWADGALEKTLAALGVEGILRQPTPLSMSQSVARLVGVGARAVPRYPVEASARVQSEGRGEAIPSRTVDLSLHGAQLEIDAPLQLGSQITLTLIPPGGTVPLELRATVVRIMADPLWGRNRLGLRFLPIAPPAQAQLEAFIQQCEREATRARRAAPVPPSHLF